MGSYILLSINKLSNLASFLIIIERRIRILPMSGFKLEVVYFQLKLKQNLVRDSTLTMSLLEEKGEVQADDYKPVNTSVDKRYKNIEFESLYGLRYHLPQECGSFHLRCQVVDPQKGKIVSQDLPIDLNQILRIYRKDGSSLHEKTVPGQQGDFVYMFALLEEHEQSQQERPIKQFIPNPRTKHKYKNRIRLAMVMLVLIFMAFVWHLFGDDGQTAPKKKRGNKSRPSKGKGKVKQQAL